MKRPSWSSTPPPPVAETAFERISWITRLPGVESPVCAAASPEGSGWTAVSASHAAPDLASVPARGLLLVADTLAQNLRVPPGEVMSFILRDFGEVGLPALERSRLTQDLRDGSARGAEDGLIEEEDLPPRSRPPATPMRSGRRALTAGLREWDGPIDVDVTVVAEILDAEGAETLGLSRECWRWWYRRWLATSAGSPSPRTGADPGVIRGGTDSARRTTPRRASGDGGDRRPAGGRAGRFQLRRWPGRPDPVRAPAGARGARRAVEPAGRVEGRRDRGQRGFTRAPEGPRGGG